MFAGKDQQKPLVLKGVFYRGLTLNQSWQLFKSVTGAFQFRGSPVVSVSKNRYILFIFRSLLSLSHS